MTQENQPPTNPGRFKASIQEQVESAESVVIPSDRSRLAGAFDVDDRARYDRSRLRYPSDLTDAEWALVAPVIPKAKRGGNKRTVDVTTDLGKNSCSVVGLDTAGRIVLRRRMSREGVISWRRGCRDALRRWKLAAVRTTSAAHSSTKGTRSG